MHRRVHLLAHNHVRFLDFAREQVVEVRHERAQPQPDRERQRREQQQREHHLAPMAVVEAANRLAERVDRIGEGEQRVQRTVEARHHLDGVEAGGAGDLQHDHRHHERLAHVHERGGKRVRDRHIDERGEPCGEHEQGRVHCLHADDQVADRAHEPLESRDHREQQPACHVGLVHRHMPPGEAFVVHFELDEHHEHERAHPQREAREQRRHRGAVGVHGVERVRFQHGRREHEIRDALGVERAAVAGELVEHVHIGERAEIGAHRVEFADERVEQRVGALE